MAKKTFTNQLRNFILVLLIPPLLSGCFGTQHEGSQNPDSTKSFRVNDGSSGEEKETDSGGLKMGGSGYGGALRYFSKEHFQRCSQTELKYSYIETKDDSFKVVEPQCNGNAPVITDVTKDVVHKEYLPEVLAHEGALFTDAKTTEVGEDETPLFKNEIVLWCQAPGGGFSQAGTDVTVRRRADGVYEGKTLLTGRDVNSQTIIQRKIDYASVALTYPKIPPAMVRTYLNIENGKFILMVTRTEYLVEGKTQYLGNLLIRNEIIPGMAPSYLSAGVNCTVAPYLMAQ